ncbi:MAG: cation-translocating P-type ATPase, partial [Ilumatobacter sp.]|nr:cation-translocating P-type ATPase [Ilumatobacter sp.]
MGVVAEPVDATEHRTPPGTPWWALAHPDVVSSLGADVNRGLSRAEAAHRLALVGPNELPEAHRVGPWRRLGRQFADPLVGLLLGAIALSLLAWWADGAKELPVEAIVIAVIVLANSLIGWWQE